MAETLLLKWGSLKGWDDLSEKSQEIVNRYFALGVSMSAAMQHDTTEQKQLILELIDSVDGEITNDWSGEKMTKEEARAYVLDYGKPKLQQAQA